MADLIPLVDLDALPAGRGLRICRAGFDLAVFKVGESVYAIDDSCPHVGGSLANGTLNGTLLRCPAHGLIFEVNPNCPPRSNALDVRRHAVRVVDGKVLLDPAVAAAGIDVPVD